MLHLSTSTRAEPAGEASPRRHRPRFEGECLVGLCRHRAARAPACLHPPDGRDETATTRTRRTTAAAASATPTTPRRVQAGLEPGTHDHARGRARWIDARLARMGLRRYQADGAVLPAPPIALVWSPMTGGAPNILSAPPRTGPGAGGWTGSGRASTRASRTSRPRPFFRTLPCAGKPFALAEWPIWGADARASPDRLFEWIAAPPRADGPLQPGQRSRATSSASTATRRRRA